MNKYISKLLTAQLFFFFIATFILTNPTISFASELIGTHLGEGDIGSQINIIKTVLIGNGLEDGSPVTVMVPVTSLQASQRHDVEDLAAAINEGGYFPIVRINRVCENFSNETGLNAIETVKMAQEIFGTEALIVWGNEINNQDDNIKGCTDWQKYYTDYSAIKNASLGNVSPAALDYYMGLDKYTVKRMFCEDLKEGVKCVQPGMSSLFEGAPRAANAYGCIGDTSSNCDPLATITQEKGYQNANNPFYLTEFSLSPASDSSDAPDTDIPKVIEFIKNRAAETGADKVTPLVRNVCNDESAWLLYINGELFTPSNTKIDENCEGTSGSNAYNTDIYPDYDIDETKSYIAPIRNIIDGLNDPSLIYSTPKLREELAKQGYQSYCATENVKIEPDYNTAALISRYFELNDGKDGRELGYQELSVSAVESLNTTNAKYPLWRDVSDKQFLMSSLEEYFGFKDVYEQSPSHSVLTSGAINSLLSEPQMCVQGWKNLVAQQLACERLDSPGECELLTRTIPDTGYNISQALALLDRYDPDYREGTENKGCSDLTSGTFGDLGIIAEQEAKVLKKVLINTPTYFDRAYRYGFVVAVIHTIDPETPNNEDGSENNIALKIFNFFTKSTRSGKAVDSETPRDEVLVATFKLPDIGTNKFQDESNGVQFWDDPLSLTRMLLSTKERNNLHEANGTAEDPDKKIKGRNEIAADIFNDAESQAGKQTLDDKIFCSTQDEIIDGDGVVSFTDGKTTTSCQNYLTKALTDIINGNSSGCGDTEAVNVIKDIAGLDNPEEKYGRVFNIDNGVEVILNLFKGDKTHPSAGSGEQTDPQIAKTDDPAEKLKSLFTLDKSRWDSRDDTPATVDFYVVYPMGFELEAVETAMKGAFFTRAQLAALEEEQSINGVDGFELTGLSMGLSSGNDGFEFEDTDRTAAGECGTTEVTGDCLDLCLAGDSTPNECAIVCSDDTQTANNKCIENVSVTVKQEGSGVGILGARLGFWMRQIQKQLSTRTSDAWNYFDSCETTEEFMLGRCTGGNFNNSDANQNNNSNTSPNIDPYCDDRTVESCGRDGLNCIPNSNGGTCEERQDQCISGIQSCQNEDYARVCNANGTWGSPIFCPTGCVELTGKCANWEPPTPAPSGDWCQQLCTNSGNMPIICNSLPVCPDDIVIPPSPTPSGDWCQQLCTNSGNLPIICNSLPICPDDIIIPPSPTPSGDWCIELCRASGNSITDCAGLPVCP